MLIRTEELSQSGGLRHDDAYQVYCGLDCCITHEVFEEISSAHAPGPIYDFERALQGPYLEIMQRGFRIDQLSRREAAQGLHLRREALQVKLDTLASAVWEKTTRKRLPSGLWREMALNPNSPKQLQEFFYGAFRIPEIWISQKGERKLSLNREVLEKIEERYLYARPFVRAILAYRDLSKQLEVLETAIDPDGRYRASYNIAGTETGRASSSANAFGTGGNAQNITPSLRFVFVADPGWKLCVIDLEQVEARDVGFLIGCLFNDWKFLDNCETGDLHTNNCKLIWPELPWTGDPSLDKELAESNFYRNFSHRDMSKRGGHLSNYYGTAWTAARNLKVPIGIMEEFQARYVRGGTVQDGSGRALDVDPAFPGISCYWQWVAQQLQTTHQLCTPFGRQRHFFGRPGDDTTLREAIAFMPQSMTADRTNLGLWRTWKYLPEIQLLAQTHDSITFQFRETADPDDIIPRVLECLAVELRSPGGRKFVVPGEAKIGWNWGYLHKEGKAFGPGNRFNPDGLTKWKLGKPDPRKRATLLQRGAF